MVPLLVLLLLGQALASAPFLDVGQGRLRGSWATSLKGRTFASFRGIPYAEPPVGVRRFQEPDAAGPWQGVLRADRMPNECLQWFDFGEEIHRINPVKGDEDCLYLNVYTPNPKSGAKLPVIVYIHGGGFIFGSSFEYGPEYLMDRDVVFVTINYRLGPLGFLSTQDSVVPGNNGLKDQSMALKWVKDNIHHFGGDPQTVTAMGMSAGGASVNFQMLSEKSRGLFQRAILESGNVCCPWTLQTRPKEKALQIGEYLGCPTHSTREMVECLKTRPAAAIVRTTELFMPFHHTPFSPFAPVVEPSVEGAFITEDPYEMMMMGKGAKLPALVSVTLDEGNYPGALYAKKEEYMETINAQWNQMAPLMFDFNDTLPSSRHDVASDRIKQIYLNGEDVDRDNIQGLIDALGDRHFVHDIERCSLQQASLGAEIYFYQFSYRGKTSLGNYLSTLPRSYGVSHGDDTGYVLTTFFMDASQDEEDRRMIDAMLDVVTSFARDGKPKVGSTTWSPIQKGGDKLNYLDIEKPTVMTMKSTKSLRKRDIWDSLQIGHCDSSKFKDEL